MIVESYKDIFIKNLREYRKERGFSQEKLAELCHCATPTIGCIETNQQSPSFEMIEKLANALQINPADFFIRDASKFSQKEEFPDIFSISQKLNSLPEIPKSSIIQLISDLSEKYSRQ